MTAFLSTLQLKRVDPVTPGNTSVGASGALRHWADPLVPFSFINFRGYVMNACLIEVRSSSGSLRGEGRQARAVTHGPARSAGPTRRWRTLALSLALVALATLSACGGGESGPTEQVATAANTDVTADAVAQIQGQDPQVDAAATRATEERSTEHVLGEAFAEPVAVEALNSDPSALVAAANEALADDEAQDHRKALAAVPTTALRSWRDPRSVENRATAVEPRSISLGMADDGRAWAVYVQQAAPTSAPEIRAALGTPTATGLPTRWSVGTVDWAAPVATSWNAPVIIPRLAVSPGGNGVVSWLAANEPCPTRSPYSCRALYSATYREPPPESLHLRPMGKFWFTTRVAWTWDREGGHLLATNDRGDQVLLHSVDMNGFTGVAVSLSADGGKSFRSQTLPGLVLTNLRTTGSYRLLLDAAGRVTVVGLSGQGLVAYRGTVSGGFGSTPTVDVLERWEGRDIRLVDAKAGRDGTLAATWVRSLNWNDETRVGVRDINASAWAISSLNPQLGSTGFGAHALSVPDGTDGSVIILKGCTDLVRTRATGWPTKLRALPSGCAFGQGGTLSALTRNGGIMTVQFRPGEAHQVGAWSAYNRGLNQMIQTLPAAGRAVPSNYVLGVPAELATAIDWFEGGGFVPRLAVGNGLVGMMLVNLPYQTLPRPGLPAGTLQAQRNLWGIDLK